MSTTLLSHLPGDIPGLLRRGSPVLWDGYSGVIIACGEDMCCCAAEDGGATWTEEDMPLSSVTLDLKDPTARAIAAAWANDRAKPYLLPSDAQGHDEAIMFALLQWTMTPSQIDVLARLVLRLAGRSA